VLYFFIKKVVIFVFCITITMSPTFLNEKGYRFFTWSKEEERKHIHVVQGEKQCKFWYNGQKLG